MSQGRHGIKVLGLSLLAALGLMAFTAAAAQAGGVFEIEMNALAANESVSGTVGEGELLVPGLALTINCTGGSFTGTIKPGGTASAVVLYSGCTVLGNKFCKTYETMANMESGANPGNLKAEGSGELVLMGTSHYLLVDSGVANFATVYLKGAGCTLPLEEPVKGSTVLEAPEALSLLVTQPLKTIPQATLESLWGADVLKYGNQTAWLDGGHTLVALSGGNINKKWGAK